MRPAAQAWEREYAKKLGEVGFKRGKWGPTMFWSSERDVRVVVHGDDFTFEGPEDELKKAKEEMESWWDIKVRAVMGDDARDDKEATILNRTVRWTREGWNGRRTRNMRR